MKHTYKNSCHKKNPSLFLVLFLLAFGGQQTFGQLSTYTFSTSTGISLENINTGSTQLISSASDDVNSSVQNIGFLFNFAGSTYSQFSVNSNGLLRLGPTIVSTTGLNQLTAAADMPKISPYWDDLATGVDGHVRYKLTGTSPNRKLVIEWKVTVPKNAGFSAGATYQAWLFETTNIIEFVYGSGMTSNFSNAGYTVGIANSSTEFISVTASSNTSSQVVENNSNTNSIALGRRYRFSPPVATGIPSCATNINPANGNTGLNLSPTLTWSAGPGVPSGYNVYFGTAPNPPLVSTAQATTSYTATNLSWNTVYYWKVVPLNSFGEATGCIEQQFTTANLLSYDVSRSTGITFNSIVSTGNTNSAWKNGTSNTDDNLSEILPIGFPFIYQEGTYSQFLVSTNGFITLNTSTTSTGASSNPYNYNNSNLSNPLPVNSPAIIAPFYEDLVCQGNPGNLLSLNNSIHYETTGSIGSRVLTVEWSGMEIYNNAGPNLNFQLKLYEGTNQIEFIYGEMEGFDGTSTYLYTYSVGLNAISISNPLAAGELITQQTPDTRNFSGTPANSLSSVPECYSKITLSPGTYTPYVAPPVVVTNNDVAGAITLNVNTAPCTEFCGTYYGSANATSSGITACTGNPDDDVWFKFKANNPSTTIRVSGSGSYNPVIELFTAGMISLGCLDATSTGLTETMNMTTLVDGDDYYVRVYHSGTGFGGGLGKFSICINATPLPPSNDECQDAIELFPELACNPVTGSPTGYATASMNIPVCAATGSTPDDDVWYFFTAISSTETITVQSGAGFNAVLQLFTGDCSTMNPLTCLNNTSTGGSESVTFANLMVGEKYYLRVYHYALGSGSGQFTICITSPAPPCATNFSPPQATSDVPASGIWLTWDAVASAQTYNVYLDTINPPATPLIIGTNASAAFTGPIERGATYFWRVEPTNTVGSASGCINMAFATEPLAHALRVKFFIEGFYRGPDSLISSIHPVNTDTIADTVTISLANKNAPYNILYSYKSLYTTYGVATAYFAQPILGQDYYIVVNHRNTLETWSSTAFGFNDPDTLFNFSDSLGKAFGNNMVELDSGVYAFHSGDVDQNDVIDETDFNLIQNKITTFGFGYLPEDLTGDWYIESSDYALIENKLYLLLSRQKP